MLPPGFGTAAMVYSNLSTALMRRGGSADLLRRPGARRLGARLSLGIRPGSGPGRECLHTDNLERRELFLRLRRPSDGVDGPGRKCSDDCAGCEPSDRVGHGCSWPSVEFRV